MLPDSLRARIATLPPAVAAAVTRAVALSDASAPGDRTSDEQEAWGAALAASGLTAHEGRCSERPIPDARTLTPAQRLVAELVAAYPGLVLDTWPVFAATWLTRRWLGLDEDSTGWFAPLGDAQEPRLLALRTAAYEEPGRAMALLDGLPWHTRVELLVVLAVAPDDVNATPIHRLLEDMLASTTAPARGGPDEWATRLVDWVLNVHAAPHVPGERHSSGVPDRVAQMLIAALVATGEGVAPRHDALLRLGWGMFEAVTRASIEAIPSERRDAALTAALAEVMFDSERRRLGALYLATYPEPRFADAVFANVATADNPARALAKLEDVALAYPVLRDRLEAARRALAGGPTLQLMSTTSMTVEALAKLAPIHRRQLEIANQRYGGQEIAFEDLVTVGAGAKESAEDGDGERIRVDTLELRVIAEQGGTALYDAWLYMGDSGTVFASGSESVVAEVVQRGVESKDRALRTALAPVLERRARPKAHAKASKPKKPATPAKAAKPSTSTKPSTPAKPAKPAKSGKPSAPTKPAKPAKSGKPSKPTKR